MTKLRFIVPIDSQYWTSMGKKREKEKFPAVPFKDAFILAQFVPREEWGAVTPSRIDEPLELPVPYVVLSFLEVQNMEGADAVQGVQQRDMVQNGLSDIQCNYLIADTGIVFEGRGCTTQPGRPRDYPGYEGKFIEVTFMGDYKTNHSQASFAHLLDVAKKYNYITKDAEILHHDKRKKEQLTA